MNMVSRKWIVRNLANNIIPETNSFQTLEQSGLLRLPQADDQMKIPNYMSNRISVSA